MTWPAPRQRGEKRVLGRPVGLRGAPTTPRSSSAPFVALVAFLGLLCVPGAMAEFHSDVVEGMAWEHSFPSHAVPVGSTFFARGEVHTEAQPVDNVQWGNLTVSGDCTLLNDTVVENPDSYASWYAEIRMDGTHCRWHRAAIGIDGGLIGGTEASRVDVVGNVVAFSMHDVGQDPGESLDTFVAPLIVAGLLAFIVWQRSIEKNLAWSFAWPVVIAAALTVLVPDWPSLAAVPARFALIGFGSFALLMFIVQVTRARTKKRRGDE